MGDNTKDISPSSEMSEEAVQEYIKQRYEQHGKSFEQIEVELKKAGYRSARKPYKHLSASAIKFKYYRPNGHKTPAIQSNENLRVLPVKGSVSANGTPSNVTLELIINTMQIDVPDQNKVQMIGQILKRAGLI